MSIAIDTNMNMLFKMFNISSHKIANEYSGMSIEDIMQAEAAQGNAAAANFDSEILNDPVKLIELFQLKDPGNKYAILSNMGESDLEALLPTLDPADMQAGLNFFNKDKLLEMAEKLPKEQLLSLAAELFSPQQIMQFMPEEQMDKILQSSDMDKGMQLKLLQTMQPEILAQMLESVTGQSAGSFGQGGEQQGLTSQSLSAQISGLSDDKFQEAMLSIPTANKRAFVFKLTQDNPKLLQAVDSSAYTDMIGQKKDKQDIVKASRVIEPEQLEKMLKELPQDLTAIVLTQMDTKKFADILISNFKDVLSQLMAG